MYDNRLLKKAISNTAQKAERNLSKGQSIEANDAQAILIKSQMDYIEHIDQDVQVKIVDLRKDISALDKKFEKKFDDIELKFEKKFDDIEKKFDDIELKFEKKFDSIELKFEKRFDSIEMKFEKRFDSIEKKFDNIGLKFDGLRKDMMTFMIWSFSFYIATAGLIITVIKYL